MTSAGAVPPPARRPVRAASVVILAGAFAALVAVWRRSSPDATGATDTFVGGSPQPLVSVKPRAQVLQSLKPAAPGRGEAVAMHVKSGRWQGGMPNVQEIERRRMQSPQVNNMKDQYFIIWIRSMKVKQWFPINIISGSEAAKTLKNVKDSSIAKAIGGDRLADYQIVRAIGMQLYKDNEDVKKQALTMHPVLKYAKEFQYGYKEIQNNTKFNDNPSDDMMLVNISIIPPEEELRNLLDDAGDAVEKAGSAVSKVGDNIKGFFGSGR